MRRSATSKNILFLLEAIGVVMVWRGMWMLLDHYLLPNNPDVSAIISIIVGIVVLLLDDLTLNELKRKK